jgi:hypothetical protein
MEWWVTKIIIKYIVLNFIFSFIVVLNLYVMRSKKIKKSSPDKRKLQQVMRL